MATEDEKRRKREQDARDAEALRKLRQQQQDERDAKVQRRLDAEAAEERAVRKAGQMADDELMNFIKDAIGGDIADAQRGLDMSSAEDRKFADEVLGKLQKAQQKGKTGKAKRIVRANKPKLKAAAKKGKKGCAVVGIMILGAITTAAAGTIWGAVEVISAFVH